MSKKNEDYLLGQSTGLDEAANFLLEKAKVAWSVGRDKDAEYLRLLAKEIQTRADDRYKHPDPFKDKKP